MSRCKGPGVGVAGLRSNQEDCVVGSKRARGSGAERRSGI